MSRIFFYFLFVLLFIAFTFFWLYDDPGYVLVSIGNKAYELSFFSALLINIFLIFVVLFFYKFLKFFSTWKNIVLFSFARRQKKENESNFIKGLIAFLEGDWSQARKKLLKSTINSKYALIGYLFAARSSANMGDYETANKLLTRPEINSSEQELYIILMKAELQFHNAQFEKCLATLLRVKKNLQTNSQVLLSLMRVYDKLNDYESLLRVISSYKKINNQLTKDIYQYGDAAAIAKLLSSTVQKNDPLNCWKSIPIFIRDREAVVECCVNQLIKIKRYDEAESFLRDKLNKNYNQKLILLYGEIPFCDHEKKVTYVEKFLKKNPNNAYIFRCLGTIFYQQDKYEIAEKYLKKSMKIEKIKGTARLLGNLYYRQSNFLESSKYYTKEFN